MVAPFAVLSNSSWYRYNYYDDHNNFLGHHYCLVCGEINLAGNAQQRIRNHRRQSQRHKIYLFIYFLLFFFSFFLFFLLG
jgi:hypothetical protein